MYLSQRTSEFHEDPLACRRAMVSSFLLLGWPAPNATELSDEICAVKETPGFVDVLPFKLGKGDPFRVDLESRSFGPTEPTFRNPDKPPAHHYAVFFGE